MENVERIIIFERLIDSLKDKVSLGIIDVADAEKEAAMYIENKYTLKEEELKKRGFTLSHHEPTESKPKDYWYTTDKSTGRKITRKEREALIDYLYDDFSGQYTLNVVFDRALSRKSHEEVNKANTLAALKNDFKRFINPSLASKDIRTITLGDLKRYTKEQVCGADHTLGNSGWGKYKVVIDLIFDYAEAEQIIPYSIARAIKKKDYEQLLAYTDREEKIATDYFSPEQIELIKAEVRRKLTWERFNGFYSTGYAILVSILTGMRVGELCALHWEDVHFAESYIHIHRQQLYVDNNPREYYEVPYTKNERGVPKGGRKFPIDSELRALLTEIKEKQMELGIVSDYVVPSIDGSWLLQATYETGLIRLTRNLGFKTTNNHAFRKSLNINVLIPSGLSDANRAQILGHSIEVNLKYYTLPDHEYIRVTGSQIESFKSQICDEVTLGHPNIIDFNAKRKARKPNVFEPFNNLLSGERGI